VSTYFYEEDSVLRGLPAAWTDHGPVDSFVAMAEGRCAFRVADLLALAVPGPQLWCSDACRAAAYRWRKSAAGPSVVLPFPRPCLSTAALPANMVP
jgi:hypothetical protein